MKVYAVVSYDLLEYVSSPCVHEVYLDREKAEESKPEDSEWLSFDIEEWEVIE